MIYIELDLFPCSDEVVLLFLKCVHYCHEFFIWSSVAYLWSVEFLAKVRDDLYSSLVISLCKFSAYCVVQGVCVDFEFLLRIYFF